MQVTRIMHAGQNVSPAPEKTREFYEEVFGLAPAARPEIPGVDGWWFSAGDGQVHLIDAATADHGINPTGPHICLGVDDIEGAVAELEQRGVEHFRVTQGPDKIVQVFLCDPAGNTLELQEERAL